MIAPPLLLLRLALLAEAARAQEAPAPASAEAAAPAPTEGEAAAADWMIGLKVAQVSLEAPDGGLPRENLEPLLRQVPGQPLDPALIRQDLALLVRAGEFAAVEVDAEPWFAFDEQGEFQEAVRIVYRVYPAPRVGRVELDTEGGEVRRIVRAAHDLDQGAPFFWERDAPALDRRVTQALVAAGWPEAQVEVLPGEDRQGRQDLRIQVAAGPPRLLEKVVVAGDLPVSERVLVRRLRKRGIRPGQPIPHHADGDASGIVRDLLLARGYLDPRVLVRVSPGDVRDQKLVVLGEAGPRTEVVAVGAGVPHGERLLEIIGLQPGTRLSEGMVDDTEIALERWFQGQGRWAADVVPRVQQRGDDALLVLTTERGPRYRLRPLQVDGAVALDPETVRAALQEAAPASLGRRVLVDADLASAARAVQELYRGEGYLEAELRFAEPVAGPLRWRPPLSRVRPLDVPVQVEEGPQTRLEELTAEGVDPAGEARLADARGALLGQAFRPGALEQLRQALVEDLRGRGFVDADARLELRTEGEVARAHLRVVAGEEVRLRSVTIQGNHHTRRSVIARELALEVGQPVTPEDLETTRRRLYDLDLFRAVTLELIGEDPRARDLIVRVEERPDLLVQVGGGVATDRGVSARGRVVHRNLAGLGHSLGALGQAGYLWTGDSFLLDPMQPVWKAGLRYEAPNLPGRGQRLIADLVLNETLQETTWRIYDAGVSLGVRARLGDRQEAFLSYAFRWRRLDDLDPGVLVAGDPWLRSLGMDSPDDPLPAVINGQRLLSGPSLALVVDRRDDLLDPRRGWRASALVDMGDGLASGGVSLRGEGRVERLLGLGPMVLALSGAGGLGWAQGEDSTLGFEDRFYLGGSGSLRGFRPGTVSPANEVARPDIQFPEEIEPLIAYGALAAHPTHWVPTGGDAMLSGVAELRLPLSALAFPDLDDTFLVGFADLGRVGFLDPDARADSAALGLDPPLRLGLGGGLRIATPIGPVSLLVGVNTDPMEERDEAPFVVHFSLGDL